MTTGFSKQTSMAAKGIAVILMLVHHLFICSTEFTLQYGTTYAPFGENAVMSFSNLAKLCVAVFVFLSAYGMTVSLSKHEGSMAVYLRRRMKKLMFSFWIVYALSIATCFLRPDHLSVYTADGKFRAVVYVLADITGLSSLFGTPSYNETWWYMTLAIILIFLTPVMVRFYEKFGICAIAVAAALPYLGLQQTGMLTYIFTAMLGVAAAKSGLFDKIRGKVSSRGKKAAALILNLLIFLFLCILRIKIGLVYWTDAFLALSLITELFLLMDCGPMRFPVLSFIGSCSMNIFLIHTLIFEYYCTAFIYSPKNWILITLLLLAVSTAVSYAVRLIQQRILRRLVL